ncbi:hypothetical protein JR316_0010865 [Psilocybe cubensis]|uniref:Uncharacterized protein n=2 Tax=Psilocybe cubensis TaxID=181762 RepID=A0ACB8GN02_PSICU|nr:hypothetical protein JR316_0010865 [Psilocybe cubensis]KAH9476949.1 hypothetical protein JR316_0010865 [Psilocybe cubensis]
MVLQPNGTLQDPKEICRDEFAHKDHLGRQPKDLNLKKEESVTLQKEDPVATIHPNRHLKRTYAFYGDISELDLDIFTNYNHSMPSRTQHPKKPAPAKKRDDVLSNDESNTQSSDSKGDLDSFSEEDDDSEMDPEGLSEEIAAARNPQADNWVFPSVDPEKGKRIEYTKALKKAQIKIGELQVTIRKLHIRNVELATYVMRFKKQKKSQKSKTSQLSNKDKRIAQLGRRFGIMNEPFVPPAAFLVARPSTFSTDAKRYESEMSQLNGVIAELFEEIPKDLHGDLKGSPDFRKTFLNGLHSCRRSMIHQLRSTTASQIFGFSQAFYQVDYDRKNLQQFQNLLKLPGETRYSKFAPILFPNNQKNMKFIFRSCHLAKMLKTVLFGPSSLNSKKKPSGRTQGRMWGLSVVTPGSIALMAVWAIFLHSPDREFASVGAISGIPYERWYMHFKSFLMKSAGKPHIQKLFAWWNGWVFSFTESKQPHVEDEGSSGMEEAELFQSDASSDEEFSNHSDIKEAEREAEAENAAVVAQLSMLQVSNTDIPDVEREAVDGSLSPDSLLSNEEADDQPAPPTNQLEDDRISIKSNITPEATSVHGEEALQMVLDKTPQIPVKATDGKLDKSKQQIGPKGRKKKEVTQAEIVQEQFGENGLSEDVSTEARKGGRALRAR